MPLFQSTPALVGRALPRWATAGGDIYGFNPRPPLWDGRSTISLQSGLASRFQSTPALVGRALLQFLQAFQLNISFNPRPPLWDGRSSSQCRFS